jgi:hypothetical protein
MGLFEKPTLKLTYREFSTFSDWSKRRNHALPMFAFHAKGIHHFNR